MSVEVATKYLDKSIKMLKVEKVNEKIKGLEGKEYQAYEITFVDKNGNVVAVNGPAKVTFPVDKEVENAYFVNSDTKEIVNTVKFSAGEDKVVTLEVEHFSLYAVSFKSADSQTPSTSETEVTTSNTASTTQQVVESEASKDSLPDTGVSDSTLGLVGAILAAIGGLGLAVSKKGKRDKERTK